MSQRRIYLDNNATTPLDPRVLEEMFPYFNEKFGNASSRNHGFGWEADEAVQHAREQIAGLIGSNPKEISFTSGATESNNLALKGILKPGDHLITCVAEHKAILDPSESLEKSGVEVTYLEVDSIGQINLESLGNAIKDNTRLVSIMWANNETGVIQSIEEIGRIAKERSILVMTDGTQAAGKIPVDVKNSGIDLMSFSAHKMYGPKGVGALYVRSGQPKIQLTSQIEGGGHERGIRSGTLNVPGIVGFGKACELCQNEMKEEADRLMQLRDHLESKLLEIEGASQNGVSPRLPHVSNLSFDGVDGEKLLLSLKDIAVSHGSACTSASFEPSHVLKSMGLTDEEAFASIRFGLGRFTSEEDIQTAIEKVSKAVAELRLINAGN